MTVEERLVLTYFYDKIGKSHTWAILAYINGTLDLKSLDLAPIPFNHLREASRVWLVVAAMELRNLEEKEAVL